MKNFFRSFVVILSFHSFTATAQNIIGFSFGANRTTGMTNSIDVLASLYGTISYGHYFKISKLLSITPAVEWYGSSYIMDGRFTKTSNTIYRLEQTPPNYSQNVLYIDAIRIPVLLNFDISDSTDKFRHFASIGPYTDIIIKAEQRYKMNYEKYKETAPIQNKMQMGLQAEIGFVPRKIPKPYGLSFHCGLTYQFTNYLSSYDSFKPFGSYLKMGIVF